MAARQHRLPAVYIGGFGSGRGKLRERPVWVRSCEGKIYQQRPDNLNAEAGAYDLSTFKDPDGLDKVWGFYEGKLQQSISALAAGQTGHIAREAFLQGMIPFIAGLCVRSADWDDWMTAGTAQLASVIPPDNTNYHRATAYQRLTGTVMRCHWHVFHAPAGSRFITNDVGFTLGAYESGQSFMFIPLNPEVGLELRRQADLPPLWQRVPGGRAAVLGRGEVKPAEMPTINRYIAEDARREVYGQQKKDVAAVQVASQRPRNPRMPAQVLTDYTADAPNPPDGDWLRELSHAGIEWPTLPVLTILNLQE